MDINLYKIIQTLIENGPTTTDELAYLEDVSGRTIENRVKELQSILKKTASINKHGNTYSLAIHHYDRFLKIQTKFLRGELDLNDPHIRATTVIWKLLKEKDYLSIDQLSDEIGLDKRVVHHSVEQANHLLAQYQAQIKSRRGKGLKIIFSNDALALLLIRNLLQQNHQFLDAEELKANEKLCATVIKNAQLDRLLALNMMALGLFRGHQGQAQQEIPNFIPLWNIKNSAIEDLIEFFKAEFSNLNKEEENFLLSPLNLSKNQYLNQKLVEQRFTQGQILFDDALAANLISYGLDEKSIYQRMKWHILFLINRLVLHEKITEVLPHNIAEKYPVAFEFASTLAKVLENKFNVKISLNEINYLVLYFETAIENTAADNQSQVVHIALIGNYRSSVSHFIIRQLQAMFPDYQVDVLENKNELEEKEVKYLFILSQEPFSFKDVPVMNANILFRPEALSIVAAIARVERYIQKEQAVVIGHDLKQTSYYAAVKELVDKLVADHELTPSFYHRWTQREARSNNVISNGIAIPHAVDNSGKKRILLSFGVVKNRVTYNKTRLKLIFLLGIPSTMDDSLVEVTSRIYDLISLISRNSVLFENAESYDNDSSFTQMLEGI